MMHIAIVDDFVFDQKHLIDLIQKNFEGLGEMADFTCYESGEAFLEAFRPGLFNAVFMDIMLAKNGLNGIETAEKLRTVAARIPLIFVSNERDYSLEGYRVHPLDYLLKPVDADALDWCLNEIRTFLSEPAYIEIQAVLGQGQSSCQRILLDDFLYAESPPDHPHVKGGRCHAPLFFGSNGAAAERRTFLYERPQSPPQFFAGDLCGGGWFCPSEKWFLPFLQPSKEKRDKRGIYVIPVYLYTEGNDNR